MSDFQDLNQNPELAAWLESLKKNVAEKAAKSNQVSNEPKIFLPKINLGKKFRQVNGKTYPEMQGSINFLLVPHGSQRVVELPKVYEVWCPSDKEWNSGYTFRIMEPKMYPEGPIRNKIAEIRGKLDQYEKEGLVSWKELKHKNYSLIKAFILMHRNVKGDVIFSNLYGGDQLVEHKYVPALLICPNLSVQTAINDDLSKKMNAVPFALKCYSNEPLKDRQGWVSMTVRDRTKGFGYDVTVSTEISNPVINPDGIIPNSVDLEDPRVKLLDTADPIYTLLDRKQTGPNGEYYNEQSIQLLESYVNWIKDHAK